MRRLRVSCAVAALAAAVLAGGPARGDGAADVAAARELFNEASRLAAEGKWAEARDRYQRSLSFKRAAITMYSLGVAQKNTGKLVEAIENFRAFLSEPQTAGTQPYVPAAQRAINEIAPRLARVTIAVEPAGIPELVVTIDGERVPNDLLDRARVANPGAHEVKASGKGYAEASQRVELKEGGSGSVKLSLTPRPEDPTAPASAPAPAPMAPKPDVTDAPPPPPPSRALPIGLMVGGGALLVGGVVVGLLGVAEAGSAPTRDGPEASSARTKSAIGDVVGGVGIAVAATGLILLVTQRPAKQTSLSPVAAGVTWAGRR